MELNESIFYIIRYFDIMLIVLIDDYVINSGTGIIISQYEIFKTPRS